LASCKEAPVTERKQLILIPESSEIKMGEEAFRKIKKESKLSTNQTLINQVKKVWNPIAKASNHANYKWDFIVIEDDGTQNAFCLPGGKIHFVILPAGSAREGCASHSS
jgi:predicted Zn-dependent protease